MSLCVSNTHFVLQFMFDNDYLLFYIGPNKMDIPHNTENVDDKNVIFVPNNLATNVTYW